MMSAAIAKSALAAQRMKLHRGATFGEVTNAPHQPLSPAIAPIPLNGTAFAINYLTLGVPADSTCKRGGARNSASRESYGLSAIQVRKILDASIRADIIELPFNRMFTVHWQAAGLSLTAMAKATGRFIDLLTRALARHGHRTTWAFIHESGDGKGGHLHLLAHVPTALAKPIARLQIGWLKLITGLPYRKGVIRSDPIGGRLGLETGNPPLRVRVRLTASATAGGSMVATLLRPWRCARLRTV